MTAGDEVEMFDGIESFPTLHSHKTFLVVKLSTHVDVVSVIVHSLMVQTGSK